MILDLQFPGASGALALPVTPAVPAPPPSPALVTSERSGRRTMALEQVIRPQVRDRWSGLILRGLTPDRIITILQSAFTGSFVGQQALFDLMEDTWPRLKKNLNELKRAIEMADWHAEAFALPEKKPSAQAEAKRDLLAQAIKTFLPRPEADEASYGSMIYDLCDAVGKGVSVQEIYWELRAKYAGAGPAIVPRAAKWVPPRYYGYYGLDPELQLSPTGFGSDWGPFPPDKFIIAFFKTKTGHPLTGALLRSLATMWLGANFSYDWALNLAQLFGLPFRWVEYDPSRKDLLDDICAMLENMGSAGWGAFPAGTKFQMHEAVKNAAETPAAFLMKLADTAADLLILGQTLTGDAGKQGSRALGEVHQDVRQDVLTYVASWAASKLNETLVPSLMRLNYGDNEEDPKLVCEIITVQDAKMLAERDQILIGELGMPVARKWLYDRHDIPIPGPTDDVFEVAQVKPIENNPTADDGEEGVSGKGIVAAKDTSAKLLDNALEDLTGIEARWLGGVKPFFSRLVKIARDTGTVTDAEFQRSLEQAVEVLPELFSSLDTKAVEEALVNAMGSAFCNGVAAGSMRRHKKERRAKQ